jgi:DNA polymerase-3 subunit gamma/tau
VELAPDRRAAAEMVLIRLCHVSDMPPPGDLVRRLTSAGESHAGGTASAGPSGGGVRAVAGGGTVSAAPAASTAPRLASFRDVTALVAEQREAMLHAHLIHSAHLVRFAPPVIELRTKPEAPRDLASRLGTLLTEVTGTRWTIALSTAEGEPTVAEQGSAADTARRTAAADHPLVRAIMDAWPGARIDTVHDSTADAYGLPAETLTEVPDLDTDAEPSDEMEFDE